MDAHTLAGTRSTDTAGAPWVVFRLTAAAVFLVSLDATVMVAAFPALRAEFAVASPALLSWTLNAYAILYAALLVPIGRLADLAGRKRLFLQGLALFTLASGLCAASPSPPWLIAARCLQAIGAAMLTPTSLALVLQAFPPTRRASAVGLWSAVGALAAAIGPAFGSFVIAHASWHWVFLLNLPVGALAWWRARNRLVESTSSENGARPDLPGIMLLVLAVALLALGIVRSEHGWNTPDALWLVAAGVGLLAVFVAWARGRPGAALDLSLFQDRSFACNSVATLFFGAAFTAMFLSSFLFQMGVWGYSLELAGLALTPGPLMVIPVAIAGGRLAGRIGHRPLLVAGGLLYAASQTVLAGRISAVPSYLAVWLPSQLATGIAIGLVLPSLSASAVARLAPQRFGVGGGVNNALRQIGGALGAAIAVALVGQTGATLSNFRALYLLLAGAGVIVALLSLQIGNAPRGATAPPLAGQPGQ